MTSPARRPRAAPAQEGEPASLEGAARRWIGAGAIAVGCGVALDVSGGGELGAWVTFSGALALGYGVHRVGRAGPDAPGASRQRAG